MNYDYIMGWETDNEEGLRGAWDIEQRDKELDADGVTAEVMFADADAITGNGVAALRGRAVGRVRSPIPNWPSPAPAPTTASWPRCAPAAPSATAASPWCPSPTGWSARWPRSSGWPSSPASAGSWCRPCGTTSCPTTIPSYDPVWAACQAAGLPVHTHSGEAPQDEYGDNIGIYLAEVVWWAARPAWHLLFSGAFERFPGLKFVVTEAAAYWAADMMWKWDQYMGGGHTTKKMAAMLKGKISKLPSDYFGENIFIGASTMSREEIRRRYVLGL